MIGERGMQIMDVYCRIARRGFEHALRKEVRLPWRSKLVLIGENEDFDPGIVVCRKLFRTRNVFDDPLRRVGPDIKPAIGAKDVGRVVEDQSLGPQVKP